MWNPNSNEWHAVTAQVRTGWVGLSVVVGDPHDGIGHVVDGCVVEPVAGVIENVWGELAVLANTVHATQHLEPQQEKGAPRTKTPSC